MTPEEIKLVLGDRAVARLEASVEAARAVSHAAAIAPEAEMAVRQLLVQLLARSIATPANSAIADRLVEHCCVELHNLVSEAQAAQSSMMRH